MPDGGATGVLNWLSEATLAGLCIFILYGSYKRLWFWSHYVEELNRSEEFWKHMALELIKSNRTLVNTAASSSQQQP
jgi:hypothetical protein